MLEKATYTNHLGEVFRFGENGAYLNCGGLRDYTWKVTTKNNRISALDRGVVSQKLSVVIMAETEAEGIEIKNRLFEVVEADVLAMQMGQLEVGGYRLSCYVTGSTKSKYLTSDRYMLFSLTIQTDKAGWVKETEYSYYSGSSASDYDYLDYHFDYDIDYLPSARNPRVLNTSGMASEFRLTIYGAAENPAITIGGHVYQVNTTLLRGEKIVIDSREKTIVQIDSARQETNAFCLRNRDSYIFQKIPVGTMQVSSNGDFDYDLILMEERSEPKWT